jgi:hypothetical protein
MLDHQIWEKKGKKQKRREKKNRGMGMMNQGKTRSLVQVEKRSERDNMKRA